MFYNEQHDCLYAKYHRCNTYENNTKLHLQFWNIKHNQSEFFNLQLVFLILIWCLPVVPIDPQDCHRETSGEISAVSQGRSRIRRNLNKCAFIRVFTGWVFIRVQLCSIWPSPNRIRFNWICFVVVCSFNRICRRSMIFVLKGNRFIFFSLNI